ncbi:hypothetical protein [Rhodonellum sp.]|uniref:hypothetical protein n=1 Tax=Rhodonellum sp. TaxID=2231180 RepID=UPI002723AA5D|nr:hypothetical protein [Rhodonellum sp.]MDO9551301.1 hypothetical protein [Rhodonellum sp.]
MHFDRLVKIEVYKLARTDYYIFTGLFVLTNFVLPLVVGDLLLQNLNGQTLLGFYHSVATKFVFWGVIVAASREFDNNVNRKRLLNGYKRHELFISQVVLVALYVLSMLILAFVSLTGLSLITTGDFSFFIGINAVSFLGFFLSLFAWGFFAVFLVNLFGRALWPILIYFALVFVEMILGLMGKLNEAQNGVDHLKYFRPMELMNDLYNLGGFPKGLILVLVIYLIVFQLTSFFILKKADI